MERVRFVKGNLIGHMMCAPEDKTQMITNHAGMFPPDGVVRRYHPKTYLFVPYSAGPAMRHDTHHPQKKLTDEVSFKL